VFLILKENLVGEEMGVQESVALVQLLVAALREKPRIVYHIFCNDFGIQATENISTPLCCTNRQLHCTIFCRTNQLQQNSIEIVKMVLQLHSHHAEKFYTLQHYHNVIGSSNFSQASPIEIIPWIIMLLASICNVIKRNLGSSHSCKNVYLKSREKLWAWT
jgi:hypothetical protein